MMRRMLGAPLGGTTVGGHHGLESVALSLITPPNFGSGGGSCFPSMVVVALGEPGTPLVCICALAQGATAMTATARILPWFLRVAYRTLGLYFSAMPPPSFDTDMLPHGSPGQ